MGARIEQGILGQRARRHHPHHITPHQRLAAAFAGGRRVFGLFCHRHLEALADQLGEVGVVAVHRHTAHGDVLALVLAAPGQRDVQGRRRGHGVIKKKLVEIPHAVEQQTSGMGLLDMEILFHHRRHGRPVLSPLYFFRAFFEAFFGFVRG